MYEPTKVLQRHRMEDERGLQFKWQSPDLLRAMTQAYQSDPVLHVQNPAQASQDAFSRALHTARPVPVTPEMWSTPGTSPWDGEPVWLEFERPRNLGTPFALEGLLAYRVKIGPAQVLYNFILMGKGPEWQQFFLTEGRWQTIAQALPEGHVLHEVLPLLEHVGAAPTEHVPVSEPTPIMLARLERHLKLLRAELGPFERLLTDYYLKQRDWPSDVFLPISAASALLMFHGNYTDEHALLLGSYASVLLAWRYAKTVVRLDPDVLADLRRSSGPSRLPANLSLGSPAIYVPVPGGLHGGHDTGFFAATDILNGKKRLTLMIEYRIAAQVRLSCISLALGEDIEAQLRMLAGQQGNNFTVDEVPDILAGIETALLILAYLASPKTDFVGKPATINEVRGKGRKSELREGHPNIVTAGQRIGDRLRAYRVYQREAKERSAGQGQSSPGTGRTMPPHLRMPHKHAYWTGPGRTTYVVHYLDFVPVNMSGSTDEQESPVRLT